MIRYYKRQFSDQVTWSFDCLNPVGLGAVRMPSCKGDTVIFNHFSKNLNNTLIQTGFNNEWEMDQAIEDVNYQRNTVSVVIYIV